MIDRGSGIPFVLIPGIQGRWEWMAPTVDALAGFGRVVTFSLCDEPTSGFSYRAEMGFDNYIEQVATAMERAGVERAVLIGVSFGGLIAAEFAARHPSRVSGLVLASALPLDWRLDARARFYLRAPRLLSPLFCVTAPTRVYPEVAAAFPRMRDRVRFSTRQGLRVVRAFLSPTRMARRLRWVEAHRFADRKAVVAPTLIVTGERGLDRVVPTHVTARCAQGLRDVRETVLPRTGHIGLVTRPEVFADLVSEFGQAVGGADAATIGRARAGER